MALPSFRIATLEDPAFIAPEGLAFDDARNRLFISNSLSHSIAWFDMGGAAAAAINTIGLQGSDPAAEGMLVPLDLIVLGDGGLIVLDAGNSELDQYDFDAAGDTYNYDAGYLGGARNTFDQIPLAQAKALAFDNGAILILDGGNSRVVQIDQNGIVSTPVTDTSWNGPSGLVAAPGGTIFVSDTQNHRVLKYQAGQGTVTIADYGSTPGRVSLPRGLAVDAVGNLYVADSGNHRIQVFDPAGAHLGVIGAGDNFAALRGLVLDNIGTLYVADSGTSKVFVYAQNPAGPLLRLGVEVLEFGSVGVGYALDRPLVVHNDGSSDLLISDVVSDSPLFVSADTAFPVPPGGFHSLLVRFQPSQTGFETGQLQFTSDSLTGSSQHVILRGHGTSPPIVDSALVLDRSGSMSQNAGGQSKMQALRQAARLFVDLARSDLGDQIGVYSFDHTSATEHDLQTVTDQNPSSRAAARTAIDGLNPGGSTSIGAGMEEARQQLLPATMDGNRKVMVVVSDGMENSPPFVLGGSPNDPRVDMDQFEGATIYTVGLGLGSEVDLGALTSLASSNKGVFYLTEDRWVLLPKFFVEIFGDTLDEFAALDPIFELVHGQPVEIDVALGRVDQVATFVLYWNDPGAHLELRLVAPNGQVVDAARAIGQSRVRHTRGATYEFFRFPLPMPPRFGRAWAGQWRIIVSGQTQLGQRISFGLSVIVGSNLGFECELLRANPDVGQPVELRARLSRYGLPVRPSAVRLIVERPRFGRGDLIATTDPHGRVKGVSKDYAGPDTRDVIAWGVANDERFRARIEKKVRTEIVEADGDIFVRGELATPDREGSYHFRFVAQFEEKGLRLQRECGHTFAILSAPSAATTRAKADPDNRGRRETTYDVTVKPSDQSGTVLGAGLASALAPFASQGQVGAVSAQGSDYHFKVTVPTQATPSKISVGIRLRGKELTWILDDLIKGVDPKQCNATALRPGGVGIS